MHHVTVCICTFKRPTLLKRLLAELENQDTEGLLSHSIVVVDNDREATARDVVQQAAAASRLEVSYQVEPQQNIALARNRAVSLSKGQFVAFIDDDEYPARKWLALLVKTQARSKADGVLGPVIPYFEDSAPEWAVRSKVFERPRHHTGALITLSDARTGNVLLKREILTEPLGPFRSEYSTGGEDVDFFRRKMRDGHVFVWCDEAPVYELVPHSRCSRGYLLRRALLRGRNSLKSRKNRIGSIVKSLLAVPLYLLIVPGLFLCRSPRSLKYSISLCDHAGKLLALVGLNPVRERDL